MSNRAISKHIEQCIKFDFCNYILLNNLNYDLQIFFTARFAKITRNFFDNYIRNMTLFSIALFLFQTLNLEILFHSYQNIQAYQY